MRSIVEWKSIDLVAQNVYRDVLRKSVSLILMLDQQITLGPFVAFRHGVVLSLHTQFGYFTEIRVEMSDMLMKICFIGFKREEERLQCVDTQVAGNPEGSEKPNKKVWKQSLTPCLFSVIPVSACARENSQYLVERIKRAN
jgi:hypothetical protein